ncbi:DUF2637 domain-containing protein [Streptomyces pinistramenti]|uniref:DUF2637 domain-containing protein n=1 Tax=Streptomyces pinistramenti TaxID=2884812 RepID=UPI001D068F4D|nr:DUF2637 domain-containing protein [Streptomyces pinistramenti]MCB5905901.1 DUF2637 domain-containing protein [Streptomyces pinistramenti]
MNHPANGPLTITPVGRWDRLAIIALGAAGCALSYDALQQMAVAIHVRGWLTFLYPLVIDGFIAYGVRALILTRAAPMRARLYVWVLFASATAASIWANALHAIRLNQMVSTAGAGLRLGDVTVGILSTLAPLALAGAVHLCILITRHHPHAPPQTATVDNGDRTTPAPTPDQPVGDGRRVRWLSPVPNSGPHTGHTANGDRSGDRVGDRATAGDRPETPRQGPADASAGIGNQDQSRDDGDQHPTSHGTAGPAQCAEDESDASADAGSAAHAAGTSVPSADIPATDLDAAVPGDGDREGTVPGTDMNGDGPRTVPGTDTNGDRPSTVPGTDRDRRHTVPRAKARSTGSGGRSSRGARGKRPPSRPRVSEEEIVARVLPHVPAVLETTGNEAITRVQLRQIMRAQNISIRNENLTPVLERLRRETGPNAPRSSTR